MPRELFSIVCDDIRIEAGNKPSFMGVYDEGIFVPEIPFSFAKLCLAQRYEEEAEINENYSLSVILTGPKLRIEAKLEVKRKPTRIVSVYVGFGGVKITEEGDYRFESYRSGNESPFIVRKFYIRINPEFKIS
jgi:Family of unknown function (DUF6941)